ncbi:MAG TPA: GNAT family N-acetyltransferase [Pseudonocardiaceae bacterium]|nr:GNAT family N-acetyltransferase [Pseudonocardiaceae bacterium]
MTLLPLADDHLEYEVELDADPAVMRYLDTGPRSRAVVEQRHRDRLAVASVVPGLGFWAGFVSGCFVGWWILEPWRTVDRAAELGYRLLPRYWRQGLAGEGAWELLRHGFADLGLTRVFAETMAVHVASRATMASVGMRHVTTYFPHFAEPIPGTEQGEVRYLITRDEWPADQGT